MTQLPEKKHDRDALQELRNRNAFAVRPPVAGLQAQALPKMALGFCYLLAVLSATCLIFSKAVAELVESMMLSLGVGMSLVGYADESILGGVWYGSVICAVVTMLISFLIYWKKPRSQHHAAFLFMISLLVIVFGFLYLTNRLV